MNILVTGTAGFIGYHLVPRLLGAGHNVVGTVRRAGMASMDSKRRLKKIEAAAARTPGKFQVARCEDYEALYNTMQKHRPEVCVHLAGKSWVRESIGYPELYVEANYKFTAALAEALRCNGCRRIVLASSVMVYGKDAPLPYSEGALGGAPCTPYGASKLASEVLLNTYHSLHKIETVNLRLFSVYGPEIRPDCVPYLIASSILRKQPFTIFGDGSSMRDYVEIGDVARAIELAVSAPLTRATLNIGSGFGTPLLDLLRLIEQCLGKPAEVVHKPAIPGELAVAIPDISLAMEKLKWEPETELADGIPRLIDWIKSPDSPVLR